MANISARPQRPLGERLRRWCRYRFLVPLKRSRHPPEHAARGVAVGLFWGLTPTVGIQMFLCVVTWVLSRKLLRWDFGVVSAMAWTWVTNFFTVIPFYYGFYVTGQILLGRWDDLSGYRGFVDLYTNAFSPELSMWEALGVLAEVAIAGWGLAMVVGCLPWAIVGTWVGYRWSFRMVVAHRKRRFQRRMDRLRDDPTSAAG